MKAITSLASGKAAFNQVLLTLTAVGGLLTATSALAQTTQCVETNGVKFLLPPQVDGGWDVKDSRNGIVLADDFRCNTTGPITDIHLWGSWLSDNHGTITNFWIGIYDDVPAIPGLSPSHPGTNLLWQQSFGPGQYSESLYAIGVEQFFDPSTTNLMGGDTAAWYYCFYPTNPFVQQGTAASPTNYWLAARAQISDNQTLYGWKTSAQPYNDAAVRGTMAASGLPSGDWQPMYDFAQKPIDLAFKLTTPTNTPPPQGCTETNGTKYVQWPNLEGGLDVWNNGPWVLGDDFVCTNTGLITDLHLWGSWKSDLVDPNTTFWLGLYEDVPAGPLGPSHPGNLKWEQTFGPGQYSQSLWGTGQEAFFDPGIPGITGPDSQVWYYCFYPTNPPVQQGTATQPKIYWLLAYAQPSTLNGYQYGWKTTTNVQQDISVFAPWPGGPPPAATPWMPIITAVGTPLDLAFKITTATNHCDISIACPADKSVECGSVWSFDLPVVSANPCCPAGSFILTSSDFTNSPACPQVIIRTWLVTDCLGQAAQCNQTVTVVDTTPPVITCASNKTVECGSAWTFDPPKAVDLCCGTNVPIIMVSTVTNSPACPQIVTRTWKAYDCCSNSAACDQTVTVVDSTPPTIVCPTNMIVETCTTNVMVTWTITATDICSSLTATSSPPSGSFFLANTTNTVTSQARDACGNTAACTFRITVVRPVLGPIAITHYTNNTVVLAWTNGILQVATNVVGPYVDVPAATPPYTNDTTLLPLKFYRLRCTAP